MAELEIKTEELEYCKIKVNYTADSDVVRQKREDVLKSFKKLPVPGFRPGKATPEALKKHYKKSINEKLQLELVNTANQDIIHETKMAPIGQPQVNGLDLSGSNFTCEMVYNKKPEFDLGEYKGLKIPSPPKDDPNVFSERMLQELRERHGNLAPYEENDFVSVGDKVTMNLTVDKEVKEGIVYDVGSNSGIDDNIIGMSPGEQREFELEGKTVKVEVHMGMKKTPCPLDDTLAKKLNLETFKELQSRVLAAAEKQINDKHKNDIAEQIKKRLNEGHDVKVPTWLTATEAQQIAAGEGVKWDEVEDNVKEGFLTRAQEQVKLALILDAIRNEEPETELSDEEAVNLLKHSLSERGVPDPHSYVVNAANAGKLAQFLATIRNDYVMNWLISQSEIVE